MDLASQSGQCRIWTSYWRTSGRYAPLSRRHTHASGRPLHEALPKEEQGGLSGAAVSEGGAARCCHPRYPPHGSHPRGQMHSTWIICTTKSGSSWRLTTRGTGQRWCSGRCIGQRASHDVTCLSSWRTWRAATTSCATITSWDIAITERRDGAFSSTSMAHGCPTLLCKNWCKRLGGRCDSWETVTCPHAKHVALAEAAVVVGGGRGAPGRGGGGQAGGSPQGGQPEGGGPPAVRSGGY